MKKILALFSIFLFYATPGFAASTNIIYETKPIAPSKIIYSGRTDLTVVDGVVRATKSYHRLVSSGASANLVTINGGTDVGQRLTLEAADPTKPIYLLRTGNLQGDADSALAYSTVTLLYNGSKWLLPKVGASGTGDVLADGSVPFTSTVTVGTDGVKMTGYNGSLTLLGLGDGTDESFTFDLNASNKVGVSSPSGVTEFDFGTLNLRAARLYGPVTGDVTGNASGLAAQYIDWNSASGGSSIANKPTVPAPVEIDAHEAASPTAAQLASVNMATIHNYGQAAADVNITLPTPAANLGAMCTVATAQAANYWRFTATGKIYLNGSATAKDYIQLSTPAVGDYFSFFTAKIADGSYAYYVTSGIGALTTN